MAGGLSIEKNKIEKFKEFIIKKFNSKTNENLKTNYLYLDSLISASALNLDFYEKIDKLAPFGSGNPEPKFLLEKAKVIKSVVVGDKHVKSILLTKDGSNIKTITFNAIETDLGQFLLNNRTNIFDIVGKLSLNEWKGEKNVEFIIDDISVNKTHKI